jgi:hypothetical protein
VLLDLDAGSLAFYKNGAKLSEKSFPPGSVSAPLVPAVQLGYLSGVKLVTGIDEPFQTCNSAQGADASAGMAGAPFTCDLRENNACCGSADGSGQERCYSRSMQDCCTTGPAKGHVCPKGRCGNRPGFVCV